MKKLIVLKPSSIEYVESIAFSLGGNRKFSEALEKIIEEHKARRNRFAGEVSPSS